jgi:hypothetical protein
MKILVLFVTISVMCQTSFQFSHGGPVSRCESLMPSHQGAASQSTPSPFKIIPEEESVGNGKRLSVEIRTNEAGRTFRGYMLQARTISGVVLGQFQAVEGHESNFRDCTGFATTVTNANNNQDSRVVFVWAAPVDFTGTIRFQ